MPGPPQMLSVAKAAKILDCSRDHIYDLIARRELEAADFGHGRAFTRIKEQALTDYIERHTRKAGAA